MIGFFQSPPVAYGPGAFEHVHALGIRRALLVLDPQVGARKLEMRLAEELGKGGTEVERLVLPKGEPSFSSVESALDAIRSAAPDWIVAVGGGSTLDAARALWVRYENPELPLPSLSPLTEVGLRRKARFLAVPSTSGSGGEAGWSLHLRDGEGRLRELSSRELIADWVLLDPALPARMPPSLTAECGVDAVAHALEALVSEWRTPFSDALAREALRRFVPGLPAVAKHPEDIELRGSLHVASFLAGGAIANAQAGLGHALAHAVGPIFALPHARAVACLLPAVVEFNFPAARELYETLAEVLGPAAVQNRASLGSRLRAFLDAVGLPARGGFGIDPKSFEEGLPRAVAWAHGSSGIVANPRVPSPAELERILRAVHEGRPVDF